MQLLLQKSTNELTNLFKVPCESTMEWNPTTAHSSGTSFPVITNERPVQIKFFEWGFYLYLDESQTILKKITTAGAETIFEKPAFESVATKRCLIPLEGWLFSRLTSSGKENFKVTINNQSLLYSAGIWEKLMDKQGNAFFTFLLLTQPVQHTTIKRMPYLLQNRAHKKWLSPESISKDYFNSITPFPGELLNVKKVDL